MTREFQPNVAVVIPTLNAGQRWSASLTALAAQSLTCRKLVIDSSSTDSTVREAETAGFEVRTIPRAEFNHGGTRQFAVDYLADSEIIVFLTQDAILADRQSLAALVGAFEDSRVAVAYGRQLPHGNASAIEAHARLFNYGEVSRKMHLGLVQALGPKVFFCSNSFAAYRRSILMELGGFRRDLILGEDAEFAARAVLAGYTNAYCADACVYHSHNYNALQILWRYFDTGVFHARNGWLHEKFGNHKAEGMQFVSSELRYLMKRAPLQIPEALLQATAKVVGYQLGRLERLLPGGIKTRLSMSPGYWLPR